MVKKKGGREMNPADAFRKTQRQKEILRNKRERKFQRDAHALQATPDAIMDQLKDVLDQQDSGKQNLTLRLKQRALQGAYDTAVKKKKEEEVKQLQPTDYTFTHAHGHGVLTRAPEDSVYYHPTLNPTGVPPPGKPQRYKTSVKPDLPASELPLPLPPPLPAGPAPGVLPPPAGPPPGFAARPGPDGQLPPGSSAAPVVLPPPDGPPPGVFPVAPAPEDGMGAPGMPPPGVLPPPAMPPPGFVPGQEYKPPLGTHSPGCVGLSRPPAAVVALPELNTIVKPGAPGAPHRKDATVSGASTVVKIPRAESDRQVTSMVPASVRRATGLVTKAPGAGGRPSAAAQVGMVPSSALRAPARLPTAQPAAPAAQAGGAMDAKYQEFMQDMIALGAV